MTCSADTVLTRRKRMSLWKTSIGQATAAVCLSLLPHIAHAEVTGFTLVDADTDRVISNLPNNAKLDRSKLPKNWTIKARTNKHAGSVRFGLNGNASYRTDNVAPYALAGDTNGNYAPLNIVNGFHKVSAIQFSKLNSKGRRGRVKKVRFELTGGAASSTQAASTSPAVTVTAKPTSTPTPKPSAPATVAKLTTVTPIPELARWESQMVQFGTKHCNFLKDYANSQNARLEGSYYDAQTLYFNIAQYTRNSAWNACAEAAEKAYRDGYAIPNNGLVYGHWIFTNGLKQSYKRTGDETSKRSAIAISQNAYFARDITASASTADPVACRETGYAIMSYLDTEELGQPRRTRLALLVNHALGHLSAFFDQGKTFRPFMVGIELQALIQYHDRTGDSRIIPAIIKAADGLWYKAWRPAQEAFLYDTSDQSTTAVDLNLIIAPAYAWLYNKTGQVRFRDRGDAIFAGGVKRSWLENIKQFNQNYWRSFEYVRLRKLPPQQ